MSLENCIKAHLDPSVTFEDNKAIILLVADFLKLVAAYIVTDSGETFYDIPYGRITEVVFNNDSRVNKSELNDLQGAVEKKIREYILKKGVPDDICHIFDSFELEDRNNQLPTLCIKHIIGCYRKLVSHIELAYIQKIFILENVRVAEEKAHAISENLNQANETITEMVANVESAYNLAESGSRDAQLALNAALEAKNEVEKTAHLASDGSRRAQEAISSAEEIKIAVEDNNKFAQQALDEAKQVKQETNDLTIQFITILGIFATIIITVFGGISVVKAASELLSSGKTSIILVSFTVGILMCSLISLVILLTSWINSVQSKDYKKLDEIRWGILTVFFFITFFLGLHILTNDKFDIQNKNLIPKENSINSN